jgi:hypothetical protein
MVYQLYVTKCVWTVFYRDVHIIELVPSSGTDSSVKPVVTVNIGVVSRSSVQVHLVLVLQSQHSVQWRLLSQGIRGMVDIIVSG